MTISLALVLEFQVFEGMEVAVVEAMKMQNMLRAEKTGKVGMNVSETIFE